MTIEQAQAARDSVWLPMHIPPGINSFNSAVSVKQGGPPETMYYSVSGPPEFTAEDRDVYRCAIAHITPAGFLNDLNGVPKARRPRLFPDRRPRVPATSAP